MSDLSLEQGKPVRVVFGGDIARAQIVQTLENMPGVELHVVADVDDVIGLAAEADVLVIPNPRGDVGQRLAQVVAQPNNRVRWIQIVSAGVHGLTSHPLPARLLVSNHGGASAATVAEHIMALLLARTRALRSIYLAMEHRVWDSSLALHTSSLEGRLMAIIGMGNIGRQLAIRASAFGVNVIGLARENIHADLPWDVRPMQQLHSVLADADIVVLCHAQTQESKHLIGYPEFAAMKSGASFVNVSRGELVDTHALRDALQSGRLHDAAIDSVEGHPLDSKASLWDAPSLIVSPHIAGSGGAYTAKRIASVVGENMQRFLKQEPLMHLQSFG